MSTVYNPYHFIPVGKRTEGQRRHDLEREKVGTGAVTHERYVPETHSGRIVCRITTKTPLVVGAKQSRAPGEYGKVEGYEVGGRPTIPGSALRGMMASLAEAASNSALRVLGNQPYSYRKPFEGKYTLSALGMIVRENGQLRLKPLALPTLDRAQDGDYFIVPPRFRKVFPEPLLKCYIGDRKDILQPSFAESSKNAEDFRPATVRRLKYNSDHGIDDADYLHCKDKRERGRTIPRYFLLSQTFEGGVDLHNGYLRVLGCWGDRKPIIPTGKKHELWLPAPGPEVPSIPIDQRAIERFHSLADERTEASLKAKDPVMPFHPHGTKRNEDPGKLGQKFRLKPNDIVYFDVTEQGVVKEISLSAIWRGRVPDANGGPAGAYAFFQGVDPDLVPLHTDRKRITIAESLFGFVEEEPKAADGKAEKHEKKTGAGLASRVRFSDSLLADGVLREDALEPDEVPLRILSSPKPPCPALYFRPKQKAGWISKMDLNPSADMPQGRKVYLHQKSKEGEQPWRTAPAHERDNMDQKNRVQPVRRNQVFWFHIDFDNLTDAEMGLLLYSLAPADGFHHKLGMGKPLGLGSIRVEVLGVFEVNRIRRYSIAGLKEARYASARLAPGAKTAQWPERYHSWAAEGTEAEILTSRDRVVGELVTRETHRAICAVGDFEHAPAAAQVHTPTLAADADPEKETYRWFVANDGGMKEGDWEPQPTHQFLRPLAEKLQPLERPVLQPRLRGPRGR